MSMNIYSAPIRFPIEWILGAAQVFFSALTASIEHGSNTDVQVVLNINVNVPAPPVARETDRNQAQVLCVTGFLPTFLLSCVRAVLLVINCLLLVLISVTIGISL